MARKDILSSDIPKAARTRTPVSAVSAPRGAVGALQSSLTRLQENAVQEIATDLIDNAGVEDRLGLDPQAQQQLVESLKTYGQQVPILLRPHGTQTGRYEIVYGRRRLRALKELGLPVKAMIRQLDDHALVMAQGQENTSRQDLSFIEKASFAAQLQEMKYDRQTIAAALSIDLPMLSRMLKVGTAFPLPFLREIGSAPGIGRDRWMGLARALEADGAQSRVAAFMRGPDFVKGDSDARFESVYARAMSAPKAQATARHKPRALRDKQGNVLGNIRSDAKGVTLMITARNTDGFDHWINSNAEMLLTDLHDQWEKSRSEDN